jgi:hypothetical protein
MGIYNVRITGALEETYTFIANSEEEAEKLAMEETQNRLPSFSIKTDMNAQTNISDMNIVYPAMFKVLKAGKHVTTIKVKDEDMLSEYIQSCDCKNGISADIGCISTTIYIHGAKEVTVLLPEINEEIK